MLSPTQKGAVMSTTPFLPIPITVCNCSAYFLEGFFSSFSGKRKNEMSPENKAAPAAIINRVPDSISE